MELKEQTKLNAKFKELDDIMYQLETQTRVIMPLVSDSIEFTRKVIKLYKEAFNQGLK